MPFCGKCGNGLEHDDRFCGNCGQVATSAGANPTDIDIPNAPPLESTLPTLLTYGRRPRIGWKISISSGAFLILEWIHKTEEFGPGWLPLLAALGVLIWLYMLDKAEEVVKDWQEERREKFWDALSGTYEITRSLSTMPSKQELSSLIDGIQGTVSSIFPRDLGFQTERKLHGREVDVSTNNWCHCKFFVDVEATPSRAYKLDIGDTQSFRVSVSATRSSPLYRQLLVLALAVAACLCI